MLTKKSLTVEERGVLVQIARSYRNGTKGPHPDPQAPIPVFELGLQKRYRKLLGMGLLTAQIRDARTAVYHITPQGQYIVEEILYG